MKKIIILGAGPTGLGAAWRLKELGYSNWAIYEKNNYVGGLAASFVDNKGFTWDVGGHVLFSHYEYFDNLVFKLLNNEYLEHLRESWIRIFNKWVPYPFQNNIRYLPKKAVYECISGLLNVNGNSKHSDNFHEWIMNTFGSGIVKYFMEPYNSKVWAYPLHEMSKDWIAERVSVVDIQRVLKNVIFELDDISWGPNNKFIFPLHGGTGEIFRRFVPYIKDCLYLNKEVVGIDMKRKTVMFADGEKESYDCLINTMPLDVFIKKAGRVPETVREQISSLKHSNGLIVGLGFRKKIDNSKCWMYFPENDNPFYRVTNFSNYSFNNVPYGDTEQFYSLMSETSCSDYKRADKDNIIEETIQGLINSGMIKEKDRELIISEYVMDVEYSYPIPTLQRDNALKTIQPYLESENIFSRGRFGGWKYEAGNMDHSTMQGVEVVNKILLNKDETVYTL